MARSEVNYLFDADTAFVVAGTGQTITSTGNATNRVALDKMVNARADSDRHNKLGAESYAVVIAVSAVDVADADETYTFTVQGTTSAGGSAVALGSLAIAAGQAVTGQYVIKIDSSIIEKLGGGVSDVQLNLNVAVGGTTPSITIAAAWVALDNHS